MLEEKLDALVKAIDNLTAAVSQRAAPTATATATTAAPAKEAEATPAPKRRGRPPGRRKKKEETPPSEAPGPDAPDQAQALEDVKQQAKEKKEAETKEEGESVQEKVAKLRALLTAIQGQAKSQRVLDQRAADVQEILSQYDAQKLADIADEDLDAVIADFTAYVAGDDNGETEGDPFA